MASPLIELAILRKSPWGESCDRQLFQYSECEPACGYSITTYSGDSPSKDAPLPAFRGEPLLMPIIGNIDEVTMKYWAMLNEENRVSLAVKFIAIADGKEQVRLVNKYSKT